jgi:hypothetical protein
VKLATVLRASRSKPGREIMRDGFVNHIQWGLLVPADPVEVRAPLQQVLGRTALTTMAGTPEGLSDQLWIRARSFGKNGLDSVQQPEGSSLAEPSTRLSLDESAGRGPVAESTGVG